MSNNPQIVSNSDFGIVPLGRVKLYVPAKSEEAYRQTEGWKDFDIQVLIPGDAADMDGYVLVNDYEQILDYSLGKDILEVCDVVNYFLADVNEDEAINVGDVTAVVNIINPQAEVVGRRLAPMMAEDNRDIYSVHCNGNIIEISLHNTRDYVAGQMDILLPEGVAVLKEKQGKRASAHSLYSHTQADGMHRIILSSLRNAAFGNDGDKTILRLEVTENVSAEDVQVTDVIFTDSAARLYHLSRAMDEATAIDGVSAGRENRSNTIYSLDGRKRQHMDKGVNIVRSKSGKIHKVVVK